MSSSDVAISVVGLSKSYVIAHNDMRATTMGEAVANKIKHPFKKVDKEEFWALRDVGFEIKKGEAIGIVGRNGAGKSTLLKVISRITVPTTGEIRLRGRIGSLLEVGTGFHQELTGRENIYLNGAILGMRRKEIDRQFDAIVDFAGTEQFLDTPVKRYSSGMYVRLGFAVAAHLNPEILIIDEVLAVGDIEFQKKCMGKMSEVAHQGRTVLFVSHNMASIKALCTRALLLQQGRLVLDGDVNAVISENSRVEDVSDGLVVWPPERAPGCEEMRYSKAYILDKNENPAVSILVPEPFSIVVEYEVLIPTPGIRMGMKLQTSSGVVVSGSNDAEGWEHFEGKPGHYRSVIRFPGHVLNEGLYCVMFGASVMPSGRYLAWTDFSLQFFIEDRDGYGPEGQKLEGLVRPDLVWTTGIKT